MTETGRIFSDSIDRARSTRALSGGPADGFEARSSTTGPEWRPKPQGSGRALGRPRGPAHGFFSVYTQERRGPRGVAGRVVPHRRRGARDRRRHASFVDRKKHHPPLGGETSRRGGRATLQANTRRVPGGGGGGTRRAPRGRIPGLRRADARTTADRALAERLCDFCLERLAYFKAPGWVLFVRTCPLRAPQRSRRPSSSPWRGSPAPAGAVDVPGPQEARLTARAGTRP